MKVISIYEFLLHAVISFERLSFVFHRCVQSFLRDSFGPLRPASFDATRAPFSRARTVAHYTIAVNGNKCPVTDSSSHVVPRILRQPDYAIVFLAKATEPYWLNSTYRLVNKSEHKRRKKG